MQKKLFRSILLGFGLLGSVAIAWRFVARLRPLPTPPWLSGLWENPLGKSIRAEILIQRAGLKPGMRVLDAGCGAGRITIPAALVVGDEGEVIALDLQPGMLDIVMARAKAAGISNVRFMLSGLGEEMLPSNRFDRAIMSTVLGEIPDQVAAMKEIAYSLKPGGIVSVTELIVDPHYQSIKTIRLLAKKVGLVETAVFGNNFSYTINLRKPLPQA
ncbi:MAG: methyltransferase domain-containing protein [Leptolinea sp.]|nr:methyltransferase domain-containing protein [Leptolinea sp.]